MTFEIRWVASTWTRSNYVGVTCSTLEKILPIYFS